MAAFEMVKTFSKGVYKQELVAALDLFSKVPCLETAVNLIYVFPEALSVMTLADDSFVRMTPKEMLGARFEGLDDWMSSFDRNLKAVAAIQTHLLKEATAGKVTIGFHRMRNQAILFERLERVVIKKGLFSNKRQFLRDRITKDASAFRSVLDLICIYGVHTGRERFWDALGNEVDPQFHLRSEIQYNLSLNVESFLSILAGIELNEKEG